MAYVDDVVAHHHPAQGPRAGRELLLARNELWVSWLRRPPGVAAAATIRALRQRRLRALAAAVRGLPWIVRERQVVPARVEAAARRLERRDP
jgi:hypothetical protein